jgi:hypothetical protein
LHFLSSSPVFDGEEMIAYGDRATVRWTNAREMR